MSQPAAERIWLTPSIVRQHGYAQRDIDVYTTPFCPSVRLSGAGITLKRLNRSRNQRCILGTLVLLKPTISMRFQKGHLNGDSKNKWDMA